MRYCRVQRGFLTCGSSRLGASQASAQSAQVCLPARQRPLPINDIAGPERDKVRQVITQPTFKGRGAG